ncbi:MAG: hypothetical protein WA821_19580 [Anaerolineales bacterium]
MDTPLVSLISEQIGVGRGFDVGFGVGVDIGIGVGSGVKAGWQAPMKRANTTSITSFFFIAVG